MNVNSDIGEGDGEDEAILACIDSANIACGVHAGSASVSIGTAWRCRKLGIEVGAHPGYDDRAGFGRVERSLGTEDIKALTSDFYTMFYHVTPSDAQIERVLAARD